MSAREDAHRLVDAVPEERILVAVELLQQLTQPSAMERSVPRRFRTIGVFEGEPDLGRRAKEIARAELS